MTPADAIERLIIGNQRFANEKPNHPHQDLKRRQETIASQSPFATIVTCSDSRVSPEVVFDEGLGDLFVVRVAGNVIGSIERESIDFSVNLLKTKLVLILGHQNCGAVSAVLQNQADSLPSIKSLIKPAIQETHTLEQAVKANALNMANTLKNQPQITSLINSKSLDVKAAVYSLTSGLIEIL